MKRSTVKLTPENQKAYDKVEDQIKKLRKKQSVIKKRDEEKRQKEFEQQKLRFYNLFNELVMKSNNISEEQSLIAWMKTVPDETLKNVIVKTILSNYYLENKNNNNG